MATIAAAARTATKSKKKRSRASHFPEGRAKRRYRRKSKAERICERYVPKLKAPSPKTPSYTKIALRMIEHDLRPFTPTTHPEDNE